MHSNLIGIPQLNGPNLQTFPQLGAFPGEIGSGNSPGGLGGLGSTWPIQMPLSYWWNFGKPKRKSRKSKRKSKKNRRKSLKRKK